MSRPPYRTASRLARPSATWRSTNQVAALKARGMSMAPLTRRSEPALDLVAQQRERHRAVLEHPVVKRLDVEFRAQGLLRQRAQSPDLEATQGIRQALRRPHRIAVHRHFGANLRHAGVRLEKLDPVVT